jgi:hypothetical protein
MRFLPPLSGRHSARAAPSLRDDLTTANETGGHSTYPTPIPVQTNPATSEHLQSGRECGTRERVGVDAEGKGPIHLGQLAVEADRLGDGQDVRLVEGVVKRRSPMAGRAEMYTLSWIGEVRHSVEIGAYQP